jgi:hypothetical protein
MNAQDTTDFVSCAYADFISDGVNAPLGEYAFAAHLRLYGPRMTQHEAISCVQFLDTVQTRAAWAAALDGIGHYWRSWAAVCTAY